MSQDTLAESIKRRWDYRVAEQQRIKRRRTAVEADSSADPSVELVLRGLYNHHTIMLHDALKFDRKWTGVISPYRFAAVEKKETLLADLWQHVDHNGECFQYHRDDTDELIDCMSIPMFPALGLVRDLMVGATWNNITPDSRPMDNCHPHLKTLLFFIYTATEDRWGGRQITKSVAMPQAYVMDSLVIDLYVVGPVMLSTAWEDETETKSVYPQIPPSMLQAIHVYNDYRLAWNTSVSRIKMPWQQHEIYERDAQRRAMLAFMAGRGDRNSRSANYRVAHVNSLVQLIFGFVFIHYKE
jgi:hypothetical protein